MSPGEQYVRKLLKRGRYSFTVEEAGEHLDKRGAALNLVLQRLKTAGWVVPFSRGFYLALDVQHQEAGLLDPAWFVDDWARHMRMSYYVGGLSAAAYHGASHQKPMQFQVFGDRQVRSVTQPGLHLATFFKRGLAEVPVERLKSPAGFFRVSTPEVTAYDIVAYVRCCPSLDHAATVLVELAEKIADSRLGRLAETGCRLPALQRLGWLLEHVNWGEKAEALHAALERQHPAWVSLETRLPSKGPRNARWHVVENTDIQPDIER